MHRQRCLYAEQLHGPATAGTNGTITPPASQTVLHSTNTTFTVTPNTNYVIAAVTGCGGTLSVNTYTTGPITGDCTVNATFTPKKYTVTAIAGTNGAITPPSQAVGDGGAKAIFTVIPSAGYAIAAVTGCGGTLSDNVYTTGAIASNCTVSATFALKKYTVTATAGINGTITPASQSVSHGSTTKLTATPNTGYTLSTAAVGVVGGCIAAGTWSGNTYTTSLIMGDCTISGIQFFPKNYKVTATVDLNGTVTPAVQNAPHGTSAEFTFFPKAGYKIATVTGCGAGVLSGDNAYKTYKTGIITGDCTVSATFTTATYAVTATAGENGSITPALQTVKYNATTTFTVVKSRGYVATATGCDGTLSGNTYTTGPITGDCTVSVTLTPNAALVSATAGANGSITPNRPQAIAKGERTTFTVTPNTGYIALVMGCDGTLLDKTYTTAAVTGDCTVIATFVPQKYMVDATAGINGTITPASQSISHGATAQFTATPNTGYKVLTVTGCGGTLSGNTYTTDIITVDCTVSATFKIN